MSNKAQQILLRLGLMAILGLVSTGFPYALVPLLWLGWTIWQDIFNPRHDLVPPPITWRTATVEHGNWKELYFEGCESPAEIKFLRGLIEKYYLEPHDGRLIGGGVTVDMQHVFENYRFDFVINGTQIIEIDGATYHSSPEQVTRDRIRDERSISQGYKVTRIPASVVFEQLEAALKIVAKVIAETPHFVQPKPIYQSRAHGKQINFNLAGTFDRTLNALDEINRYANCQTAINKYLKPAREAVRQEKMLLDHLEQAYSREIMISQQSEQFQKDYKESSEKFAHLLAGFSLPSVAWDDLEEVKIPHDERFKDQIQAAHTNAMEERAKRLLRLKMRCTSDADLTAYFFENLLRANCPIKHALEILPATYGMEYDWEYGQLQQMKSMA